jgi:hypothetical protein
LKLDRKPVILSPSEATPGLENRLNRGAFVRRRLDLPAIRLSLAAQQRTPPLFPRLLGGKRRSCEFFEIETLRLDVQLGCTQRLVEFACRFSIELHLERVFSGLEVGRNELLLQLNDYSP